MKWGYATWKKLRNFLEKFVRRPRTRSPPRDSTRRWLFGYSWAPFTLSAITGDNLRKRVSHCLIHTISATLPVGGRHALNRPHVTCRFRSAIPFTDVPLSLSERTTLSEIRVGLNFGLTHFLPDSNLPHHYIIAKQSTN